MSQPPGFPGSPPPAPDGPQSSGQPPSQAPGPGRPPRPGGSGWEPAPTRPMPTHSATQPFPAPRSPVGASGGPAGAEGSTGRPEKPPNGNKVRLIVGAVVLALVLLVVGGLLFNNYQARVAEERAAAAARAELARQESAAKASAQGYLTALTESAADKALSYAVSAPEGDNELMSRDVLLEANKRAAISGVGVDEAKLTETAPGNWTEGTVKVRYTIGDQPQTVDLPLRRIGADWKLEAVTAPVSLGLTGPERLVNGVPVLPGDYNLFPGSYSITSTNPLVALTTTEFVLTSPVAEATDWAPEIVITDEGTQQSLEASKQAVADCLQLKELAPPACPFIRWAEEGLAINQSTIRYTLKNDPWTDVRFQFDAATMTATTTVDVTHEIQAQATQNGRTGSLVPQTQTRPAFITVNLAEGEPQVSFS